ncbi:hypothetical protein GCM10023094_12600 [Rhodococcus olei]|uniref:Uncharacterized protein n=1 Tax=Rhodococcus olei TaxID=2161675 RepID=A0ABP8NVQ8_9NOCA
MEVAAGEPAVGLWMAALLETGWAAPPERPREMRPGLLHEPYTAPDVARFGLAEAIVHSDCGFRVQV